MSESEHDAFLRFTEALKSAEDAAKLVAHFRNDQRWEVIAQGIAHMRDTAFHLAGTGAAIQ